MPRSVIVDKAADGPGVELPSGAGLSASELHFRLIEQISPPSILINAGHDIVHVPQTASRFLQSRAGEPGRNLLRAVHPAGTCQEHPPFPRGTRCLSRLLLGGQSWWPRRVRILHSGRVIPHGESAESGEVEKVAHKEIFLCAMTKLHIQIMKSKSALPTQVSSSIISLGESSIAHASNVAERAYLKYENSGYADGNDVQHWLEAESELSPEK